MSQNLLQNNASKILIVDDEIFNVDYMQQEIEDLGLDTVCAYNGPEALRKVADEKPDLVLLDIMMPGMNGFEVLTRLKEDPQTRDIPVIIISALSDVKSIVHGIELGAEDYMVKPFNDVLLRARIHNGLQKRRWRLQEITYLQQIEDEKQRVDELLHVILPDAIVSELKSTNRVQPREYSGVAVLFADIIDFTQYCDTHSPLDVLTNLQSLVIAFEQLAVQYSLEKIKTVGDAFMAAGGLLQPLDNPVLNCVQCGIEMIQASTQMPAEWGIRVGIHYGSVMAGLVGKKQYLFDIWGDTVNTAQRIQENGQSNAVNLSKAALDLLTDKFTTSSLGLVEIKGKGPVEIFYVMP